MSSTTTTTKDEFARIKVGQARAEDLMPEGWSVRQVGDAWETTSPDGTRQRWHIPADALAHSNGDTTVQPVGWAPPRPKLRVIVWEAMSAAAAAFVDSILSHYDPRTPSR